MIRGTAPTASISPVQKPWGASPMSLQKQPITAVRPLTRTHGAHHQRRGPPRYGGLPARAASTTHNGNAIVMSENPETARRKRARVSCCG
jgi:hypothetical protein